jgi:hypothetical protein
LIAVFCKISLLYTHGGNDYEAENDGEPNDYSIAISLGEQPLSHLLNSFELEAKMEIVEDYEKEVCVNSEICIHHRGY